MKNQLTDLGIEMMDALCEAVAVDESRVFVDALKTLPQTQRNEIEKTVAAYVAAVQESAFLAGLEAGGSNRALLVK